MNLLLSKPVWRWWLGVLAISLILAAGVRIDVHRLRAVTELSDSGSPPPDQDRESPTGYARGQRHLLGKQDRGETYRWIAATQELRASGALAAQYAGDTVPTGRPQLLPRLYAAWLAAVAQTLQFLTGDSPGLAVERAALWEPVIAHVFVFLAAVWLVARRHGLAPAIATALFIVLYPPLAGQFLPGVLSARTWALFLAATALALTLPGRALTRGGLIRVPSAVCASLALWLDPAAGFPAVLLLAAAGATGVLGRAERSPFLLWSGVGAALVVAGWWIDGASGTLQAGELRYVHPLYAVMWVGLGLALDAFQALRAQPPGAGRWRLAEGVAGVVVFLAGILPQVQHGYAGWIYPSLWMRRFSSVDPTAGFAHAGTWAVHASPAEWVLISSPLLAAAAVISTAIVRARSGAASRPAEKSMAHPRTELPDATPLAATAVIFGGLLLLTFFRLRWTAAAAFLALPILCTWTSSARLVPARIAGGLGALLLAGLLVWQRSLPPRFDRPLQAVETSAADVETLVYRQIAHWLANHAPASRLAVLAPPELSDAVVFHGGGRALVSTAWESYPGQLAARRILSAPEWTEVESVVQGHELTHVIVPSWDTVLGRFVQAPVEPGKEAALDRLRRWVLPPFLRPLPYRLPPLEAFTGEQLALFQVTTPQDEPLLLGRLAEYFVEMERTEPARLVARVLADSYPDEPDAMLGRAAVHLQLQDQAAFLREADRLARAAAAGQHPMAWDRRVQRAIVLALARKRDLARREVEACLAQSTQADLFELTPLQAYRLTVLAKGYALAFPSAELGRLAARLSADYSGPGRAP